MARVCQNMPGEKNFVNKIVIVVGLLCFKPIILGCLRRVCWGMLTGAAVRRDVVPLGNSALYRLPSSLVLLRIDQQFLCRFFKESRMRRCGLDMSVSVRDEWLHLVNTRVRYGAGDLFNSWETVRFWMKYFVNYSWTLQILDKELLLIVPA
jgi:hypothetical protein